MEKHEVIIYSSTGCPHCEKVKEAFKEWGVDYEERNVSNNKQYFDEIKERKIYGTPATLIDGKLILGFQEKKLKKALNIEAEIAEVNENKNSTKSETQLENGIFQAVEDKILDEVYDFVAIGGGPAGSSAAVYSARGKLNTLIIDKAPKAGTLALTHKIANYPGVEEELTGLELLTKIQKQAKGFGASFVRSTVISVDFSNEIKKIEVAEGTIKARSVFIAVGAKASSSKIKGEEEFIGRGVSYCSTCDAAFFQDKNVAVVGDNEEAVHEAETLAKFCKTVKFLIPTKLKGAADLTSLEHQENVEIYMHYRLKEIIGDGSVEKIVILDNNKEERLWDIDGVFLYLDGMKPGTGFLKDKVALDKEGYVIVDDHLRTNIPGVFAGGDARKTPIKQAVLSAADGAVAALSAEQYVNGRSKVRPQYS